MSSGLGYLVKGPDGWNLLDQNGRHIARANAPGVYFACLELDVKRVMFGSYNGRESWLVQIGVLTPERAE